MRTQPTPALAGLLAMLALPGAALADTMGTIPVDPDQQVTGRFDASPGKQTWLVRLERGRYYAFRAQSGAYEDVTVRAPGGSVAASFAMSYGDYNGDGTSFRALVAGWHTVEVSVPTSCFDATPCLGQPDVTGDYLLSIGRDCPGDLSTSCTIAVGQTLPHLWLSYDLDVDTFRTRLAGGTAYTVGLTSQPAGGATDVAVLDERGAIVAQDAGGPFSFVAPASGTYYVDASGGQGGIGVYGLSLTLSQSQRRPR